MSKFDYLCTKNKTVWLFNVEILETSVSCGLASFLFKAKTPIELYDPLGNHVVSIKSTEVIEQTKTQIVFSDPDDQVLFEKV